MKNRSKIIVPTSDDLIALLVEVTGNGKATKRTGERQVIVVFDVKPR